MAITYTNSLAPVEGELSERDLLHLLRRTMLGVGHNELKVFDGKNIDQCMEMLLKPSPKADLVQHSSDVADPLVPLGKDWHDAPYENDLINNRRGVQLKMWWVGQILSRDYSLTEKMRLFWHNHFVTEMDIVKDSRYSYRYVVMLRDHALGNFKKLIREGTTNIAMLVYLNGNTNGKAAPNENYARELMELFTLGKQNNPNYTEDDVKAAARVLTGWKDDKEKISVVFDAARHDTSDKKFSAFFDNHVIKGRADGAAEIDELIDMIFGKMETAKFVCRNLYRWFVTSHIDENIERDIITPLARVFMDHNFEIAPVLRTLLSSEHFFDPAFRGCVVKSPVDYFLGATMQFPMIADYGRDTNFERYLQYYFYLGDLSMDIGNPPSVAGWPAYYQAPKYHQWWINSASLGLKAKLMNGLATQEGLGFNGTNIKLDFVEFAARFNEPGNLDIFVADCLKLLLAVDISDTSKKKLKEVLLSGQQSEKYWTTAWDKYVSDPTNGINKSTVESRLILFFKKIINMPEFQMM